MLEGGVILSQLICVPCSCFICPLWLYAQCLFTQHADGNMRVFICLHVQNSVLTICLHSHREHYRNSQSVCQGIAMLWAARLCESLSLGAIDRPLGPAGTQGPICSTECVILSQQACHSSNHSNTHSFLEFWILRPPRTIKTPFICLVLEWACLFDS